MKQSNVKKTRRKKNPCSVAQDASSASFATKDKTPRKALPESLTTLSERPGTTLKTPSSLVFDIFDIGMILSLELLAP